MEFLVALIIAGAVAFFVVQDAKAMRDEEIEVYGGSTVSPGLWGTGVFLMAIIFLPAYIFVRVSSNKQIARVRLAQASHRAQSQLQVPPAAQTPPSSRDTAVDEITKAYELLSQGAINEQEYEVIKAQVLA